MSQSYSKSSKILHWAMALMLLSMLALGFSMVENLAIWHIQAIWLHKSFGLLALVIVVIRIVNRWFTVTPPLPSDVDRMQAFAAKATQVGLYGAMLLMPVSGYLMQSADNRVITFFGLFPLPSVIAPSIERYALFREMHAIVALVFLVLITVHICGALYHGIVRRDKVLSSMTFSTKRAQQNKRESKQ